MLCKSFVHRIWFSFPEAPTQGADVPHEGASPGGEGCHEGRVPTAAVGTLVLYDGLANQI